MKRQGAGPPPAGWKSTVHRLGRRAAKTALLLLALLVLMVVSMRWVPPLTSTFMLRHQVLALFRQDAPPLLHRWVDLDDMSPNLPLAVLASEDQLFADHWGFDMESIGKAFRHNSRGRRIRGASTISQQTAKNLFLWPGRSWLRKGMEAGITVLLEVVWPKRRILEVYLNVAQFGDGIYGVGAACDHLLGTTPQRVSAAQAARLAAVLPSPRKYSAARPGPYVRQRAAWIQGQMRMLGGAAYLGPLAP